VADQRMPRNRQLYEQGCALRAEILAILAAHSPLRRPLIAKDIQPRLSRVASLRAIQWHMQAIRGGVP
jgi:hypothetical protein